MASTYSALLRLELIGTGEQSGTWGITTNTNLGTLLDEAVAGTATVDVTAGNVTLTVNNGSDDQSRNMVLRVIGSAGTTRNIIAPGSSKLYLVVNGSDSSIVLKSSVSTGVTIPSGQSVLAYYDTTSLDFSIISALYSSSNIANRLVYRDGSGNFSANTITASSFVGPLSGAVTGNLVGNVTGNIAGDVYAADGTSLVLNNGTNGTDATFAGATTGAHNGSVGATTASSGAFTTLSATGAITYGGVTLTNAVTGTGKMVLDASPTLSGTPLAPTAAGGTNTTQIATTGFVQLSGYNSQGAKTVQTVASGAPTTGGNDGDIIYQY